MRDFYHFPINAFILQMGNAFGHLRGNCIAHKDVKANNILIAKNNFKLCDMGCARYVSEDSDLFVKDWYGVGIILLWLHLTESGQNNRIVEVHEAILDIDPLLKSRWMRIEKLVLELTASEGDDDKDETTTNTRPNPDTWKTYCFGEDEMEIGKIACFEPIRNPRRRFVKWDQYPDEIGLHKSFSYSKPM